MRVFPIIIWRLEGQSTVRKIVLRVLTMVVLLVSLGMSVAAEPQMRLDSCALLHPNCNCEIKTSSGQQTPGRVTLQPLRARRLPAAAIPFISFEPTFVRDSGAHIPKDRRDFHLVSHPLFIQLSSYLI